jgi:hypothetical protein
MVRTCPVSPNSTQAPNIFNPIHQILVGKIGYVRPLDRILVFFQWLSPSASDMSSALYRIPGRFLKLVWRSIGHVLFSNTPMGKFPSGTIKGGLHPLCPFGHSIDLKKSFPPKILELQHYLLSFNQIQAS